MAVQSLEKWSVDSQMVSKIIITVAQMLIKLIKEKTIVVSNIRL